MKAIRKEFWREIRNTRSRFLSILILVALAVSFLSGLRSTAPDMKNTGDSYLDAQNFMDIQVMSTLGLTEEDLEVLSSQPHILDVEGIWNIDAFASGPDLDIVVKVWSLPQRINQVTVTDGRLPEAADECAVEENLLETLGLEVGDTLQLKTQGDYADALTASAFTIVGTVVSPYYISVERGTSTLGTGQVSAYVYLPASSFDMDSYTSAFLLVEGAKELTAFYSDYTDLVDGVIDTLEPLGKERAALRREELVDDANEELEKAQKELDDAKAEAEQELADAWQELLDARAQLDDGWADLSEGKETLAQETADAQKKLSDAKKELADAQIKLDDGEQEYAKGVIDYQDGQRETAEGWKDYEEGLAEYEDGKKELDEAKKKLDDASATLAASHYQLTTAQNQLQQLLDQLAQPVGQILAQQGVSLPITSGSELLAAMQDETYGPAVRQAMTQVLSILYQASGMASADELLALAQTDPVTAGTIAQFLLPSVNQALEAMGQTPLTSAQELLTRLAAENVEPEPEPEPDPDPNPAPEPDPGGDTTDGDGTDTGDGTDPDTGTQPGGDTGTGDGTETGGGSETGGGTDTDTGTQPGGGTDTGDGTDIGTGEGTETGGDTGTETDQTDPGDTDTGTDTTPDANTTPDTSTETPPASQESVQGQLSAALVQQEGEGEEGEEPAPPDPVVPYVHLAVDSVLEQMAPLHDSLGSAANPGTAMTGDEVLASYQQLQLGWAQYQGGVLDYEDGKKQYEEGLSELEEAKAELDDAKAKLDDAERELLDAKEQLDEARTELDDGWKEYRDGLVEFSDGERELEENIAKAQQELSDATHDLREGEVEYNDGLNKYYDGKQEAEEKIADGEKELADARRKVADIDTCEWYILSRDSNPGYLGFGQDADRMGNLASVFPVLFFLVAALVCLTTMTRMVEDQRVQIGCLKALGYGRLTISRKYLGYGALPALLGGILGLAIGYTLFPTMIFTAYQIMYDVPDIQLSVYADTTLFSLGAALACTTVATLWACLSTLASVPAELMRPRAPKPGKRVILEYIRPLWRRMNFNMKVTARNLFRYQKRFWMTVIGIGGCTALIIAGFGLRSSLLVTMDRQYDELYHYTAQLSLSENVLDSEREAIADHIASDSRITDSLPCRLSSVTAESPSYSLSVYLDVVPPDEIGDFVDLHDYRTGEPLVPDESGVIITQKMSELLNLKVGDTFTVDSDGRFTVTVAGIAEHYLAHFIYMTPAYYEQVFGEEYSSNAYLLTFASDDQALCDEIFAELMDLNGVAAATRTSSTRDTYQHSMERIDFVVVIVILSAAALAMVVLYNLSNINITERQRELATIKVLGFYDREVSAYVYRENIVLTVFGIALGIAMGHFLHVWLVRSVEIELMMFGRETDPMAYVWAACLTVLFSVLVNLMAHRKMKKIDMVESLKSAE